MVRASDAGGVLGSRGLAAPYGALLYELYNRRICGTRVWSHVRACSRYDVLEGRGTRYTFDSQLRIGVV